MHDAGALNFRANPLPPTRRSLTGQVRWPRIGQGDSESSMVPRTRSRPRPRCGTTRASLAPYSLLGVGPLLSWALCGDQRLLVTKAGPVIVAGAASRDRRRRHVAAGWRVPPSRRLGGLLGSGRIVITGECDSDGHRRGQVVSDNLGSKATLAVRSTFAANAVDSSLVSSSPCGRQPGCQTTSSSRSSTREDRRTFLEAGLARMARLARRVVWAVGLVFFAGVALAATWCSDRDAAGRTRRRDHSGSVHAGVRGGSDGPWHIQPRPMRSHPLATGLAVLAVSRLVAVALIPSPCSRISSPTIGWRSNSRRSGPSGTVGRPGGRPSSASGTPSSGRTPSLAN